MTVTDTGHATHAQPTAALDELQGAALRLLAGLPRPPRSMRLRTDQAEIHLEWPEPAHERPEPAATEPAAPVPADEKTCLTATTVGVFYRAPEPGAPPFVQVGDIVRKGQQVGIIEAMKLMLPAEATAAGRVLEVLVADGAAVEYGDHLFVIDPADTQEQ